jgi:glutamate-1-semialdehyde 2,1-aminomutase
LDRAATAAGVPHRLNRVGSMWTLFFSSGPVPNYASAIKSDVTKFSKFFWAMMDRGVYLPCSQFEAAFVSAAHTEEHIDMTIAAANETLKTI